MLAWHRTWSGAFIVGGLALASVFVRPYLEVRAARSWAETECEILHADRLDWDDGDGLSHDLMLVYRYRVDGREYAGNDYGFYDGWLADADTISELADELREAKTVPCYHDPALPERAVIDRDVDPITAWGAAGLGAVLIGVSTLVDAVRRRRRHLRLVRGQRRWRAPARGASGRYRLEKLAEHDGWIIAGAGLAGVAITTTVGALAIAHPWTGMGIALFWTALLTACVLALLVGELLALLGPYLSLEIDEPRARPGDRVELHWRLRGLSPAARGLRFTLVGRERAIVDRGEDDLGEQDWLLQRLELAEIETRGSTGAIELAIPPELMPSFASEHHRIDWSVEVDVEVDWWPDEEISFALELGPPSSPAASVQREPSELPRVSEGAGEGPVIALEGPAARRPGQAVDGVVRWRRDAAPDAGALVLAWCSRAEGTEDEGVVASLDLAELPRAEGAGEGSPYRDDFDEGVAAALQAEDARRFRLTLPAAPLSFHGRLVRVDWELRATLEPGEGASTLPLISSPTGAAIEPPEPPKSED